MLEKHPESVANVLKKCVHKVSRLIDWPPLITKVTFYNAFRSCKGLPEFKAKKKLEKVSSCLSRKTGEKIAILRFG